ncbi:FecR family protein [Stakelama sediminis]|uniref:Transmembrane sensor n=1 Tax=Stakelama sediminis TaxID=463200 RepID=A0A840Z2A6_9SPHN|nr:FecR domain-containing protein [Stakelama sediminis]MBB5719929.1 transmembrane sensor [Stakelama sediminis]
MTRPGAGHRSDETIRREAADWAARAHDPDGGFDPAAFDQWRDADPRHADIYARMEAGWNQAGLLAQTRVGQSRGLPDRRQMRGERLRPYVLAAAAVLLIAVLGVTLISFRAPEPAGQKPVYASKIGQIRQIRLADGSQVTLDTNSRVEVAFDPHSRRVRLVRGRARFTVTHDVNRPFTVTAAGASVTARGTIFDVALIRHQVRVTLLRGAVDVRNDETGNAEPLSVERLRAAQTLAFRPSMPLPAPRPIQPLATQWPSGMLGFDDTPLAEAVAEANRYSTYRLRLADPELGRLKVSGAYRAGDLNGFAEAVAASFHLHLVTMNRGELLLTSAGTPAT